MGCWFRTLFQFEHPRESGVVDRPDGSAHKSVGACVRHRGRGFCTHLPRRRGAGSKGRFLGPAVTDCRRQKPAGEYQLGSQLPLQRHDERCAALLPGAQRVGQQRSADGQPRPARPAPGRTAGGRRDAVRRQQRLEVARHTTQRRRGHGQQSSPWPSRRGRADLRRRGRLRADVGGDDERHDGQQRRLHLRVLGLLARRRGGRIQRGAAAKSLQLRTGPHHIRRLCRHRHRSLVQRRLRRRGRSILVTRRHGHQHAAAHRSVGARGRHRGPRSGGLRAVQHLRRQRALGWARLCQRRGTVHGLAHLRACFGRSHDQQLLGAIARRRSPVFQRRAG